MLFVTGDHGVQPTLNLPESIFLEEAASGSCVVSNLMKSPRKIIIAPVDNRDYCSVKYIDRPYKIKHLQYRQNFTVTCRNGSASSVVMQCFIPERNKMPKFEEVKGKIQPVTMLLCKYFI